MRAAVLLLVPLTCAGCPALGPPGDLPSLAYHHLPSEVDELHRIADRVHRTSRKLRALVKARSALRKVETYGTPGYDTLWRLARVDAVLARLDTRRSGQWAREGLEAGERAREMRPDRVEGHLYTAACLGFVAKSSPSEADRLSREMIAAAEKANEIAPDYAGGEARRILGAVYLYAPAWPSGVGDLDEAIEVLQEVHKDHPEEPLNAFYLAEAWRRAERPADAIRLYEKVLRFPKAGIWGLEGHPYRKEARQHIRDLRSRNR